MHVIIFTIDCGRADHFDGSRGLTPELDAIRGEGTTFSQAFSQSQNTLSSHVSLLTSNYLFQHGVYSNYDVCTLPAHALPFRLAERGFATRAFTGIEFLARGLGDRVGEPDTRYSRECLSLVERLRQRVRERAIRIPADANVTAGLEWLDQGESGQDRFLWLHEFDTHMVYTAPRRFLRRHAPRSKSKTSCREQVEAGGWHCPSYSELESRVSPGVFPARYRASVEYVDACLARLIRGLKERSLWDDVLLVVTADHGECLEGDHGMYCMHQKLFDLTVHVPLWIRFPSGEHAGEVVDEMVELVDVAPTIANVVGLAEPMYMGRDLRAIAAGEAAGREYVFAEHVGRLMLGVRDREHLWMQVLPEGENREGILLEDGTLFTRDGSPVAGDPPEVVEPLRRFADELVASRPEVASTWNAHGTVDAKISEQLRALGYF